MNNQQIINLALNNSDLTFDSVIRIAGVSALEGAHIMANTVRRFDRQIGSVFGEEAYKNGAGRAPAQDKNLTNILNNRVIGEGKVAIEGWLVGWDNSNLMDI